MPDALVIDANVFAVAAGLHPEASPECVDACLDLLARVGEGKVVAIDTAGEILNEYQSALAGATGGELAALVATKLKRMEFSEACRRTEIVPSDTPPPAFRGIPDSLHAFDLDDQKYLAVSSAVSPRRQIAVAKDSDWWDWRDRIAAEGFDVQFLCWMDFL